MNPPLRIAIAGLGTVGAGVVRLLTERSGELSERVGREIRPVLVCARDRTRQRPASVAALPWVDDPLALAQADVDVVVELIGGESGVAPQLIRTALAGSKHVVTANKALLARHGAELAALAETHRVGLKFEAAVAGGIPIVKALRESLVAHGVNAVRGVLNGTCNYILTQMEATGRAFDDVLAEAQRLGFAEADPTLDIGGGDTAHKLALLSGLAFGSRPDLDQMSIEGIGNITPQDIAFAREFNCRIKLLGVARMTPEGLDQRVGPAMVKLGTPLADVEGAFNAVVAHAGEAGPFFFEGRGAGEAPTAASVIADLLDIARGAIGPAFGRPAATLSAVRRAPPDARICAFYLKFDVLDAPGVLAEISRHLATAEVSIESMIQRGRAPGEAVGIVMITHECTYTQVANALKAIAASDKVLRTPSMIPMELG